nr:peptidase domain-containing ABC transporter [uncultured Prevotella sp.]
MFNSFPFVRQHDSMQCGIACLQMVCLFYGRHILLTEIERLCHATTEGVSLLGISEAAKSLGYETVAARATLAMLTKNKLPCILHWNQNHFVVLYRVKRKNTFCVADPGKGLVEYGAEEFKQHWVSVRSDDGEEKGIAMFFKPTERFYQQKPSVPSEELKDGNNEDTCKGHSLHFLWHYASGYKRQFAVIFLTLLVGSLFQLLMPFLTQGIVDWGIENKDISLVWLILLGELAIVIGHTATDFIRRWLLLRVSMQINIALVSDFFIKLLRLPMSFFDTKLMGDLLQRMNDHGRVQSFLTNQALGVMFTSISFVVFGAVLAFYDLTIFAVFIVGSLAYGLWLSHFLGHRKVLDYELFEQQAINQNKTYQFITAMQEIKLQQCERRRREEWEQSQRDLFHVQTKSLRLQQAQEAGSILINELKNILITVLAATAVIHGNITLGMMLATQYIVGQLNSPVEQLMSFIFALQDVKISLERINEIHHKSEENAGRERRAYFSNKKGLELKAIDFRYDLHSPRKTINGVSFCIPEGKVTAIVGASGSGKTTILKLLLGYYPVESGTIVLSGCDLSEYNLQWWRSQCGVVMQDGVIFSESIERNIAVDDSQVDHKRLEWAAHIACIHDHIMSLPLQYDTKIGRDGVGLSQGQRQRILIARAVYKNPDFIFLDEATNSLDANNERMIVENLDEFYKGKTVVIVAHRLSTVKSADQIVVLDNGKVVETGNHKTLTSKRGAYYNLVKNQLELGN